MGGVTVVALAAACRSGVSDEAATRRELAAALARYQRAAVAVNADSTAASFSPTGTLFEPGIQPVSTPDSIRAFVRMFTGARVHEATADADTLEIFGTTALMWGHYHERLSFPGQPDSDQRGRFVIEWKRQPDGAWLIERLYRIPLPEPVR